MYPRTCAALVALTAALPGAAVAASVYLNGVNIDGVTNQRFEKASVRIDEQGNVFIEAVGYAARVVPAPPPAAPVPPAPPAVAPRAPAEAVEPARLTQRYWLVTEQTARGMTEFDIDLYINAVWFRKLRNTDESLVIDITPHLKPGRNTLLFSARKLTQGARKSYSPAHVYRVLVGEGNVGGDHVMIERPLVRLQRSASEAQDVSEEFTLTTR